MNFFFFSLFIMLVLAGGLLAYTISIQATQYANPLVCETDKDEDHDMIINCIDMCPTLAEFYNRYYDSDGCPDLRPETYNKIMRTGGLF